MKRGLEEFGIPFSGLKPGRYEYRFEVDDSFFEHFEQSEITKGNVVVTLELQRQPVMLSLAFTFEGTVNLICDRCGDPYDETISGKRRMVVHIGGGEPEDEDDIVILHAHEHLIELSRYIYEYITLLVPQRRIHPEGQCDPEVIQKLNELRSGDDEDGHAPSDPRWAALKGLSFDKDQEN